MTHRHLIITEHGPAGIVESRCQQHFEEKLDAALKSRPGIHLLVKYLDDPHPHPRITFDHAVMKKPAHSDAWLPDTIPVYGQDPLTQFEHLIDPLDAIPPF